MVDMKREGIALEGKRAIVTGAGGGLGRQIAYSLAESGADVAVWDIDHARLEETVAGIRQRGVRGTAATVDVTVSESLEIAVAGAAQCLGGVDIVVNNAGVNRIAPAVDVSPADWDRVFDVNLKGAFFVAQAVARYLIHAERKGCVVNMSSTLARMAMTDRTPYLASKAGISQMTRGLALEWSQHGIRVNAVAPAVVETEMTRATGASAGGVPEKMLLGRLIDPSEIGAAVAFLASDAAAMITGQTLNVDAGWSIH